MMERYEKVARTSATLTKQLDEMHTSMKKIDASIHHFYDGKE